ncbi:MAG: pentapeptide repeat-containing protein [Aulosira sp. DedQUE10]|nr:pentapeptide repeat-containing protein [Aulosira sp. DedQUE10]
MSGADLSEAYMTEAILRGANLTGANLSNTEISGVDFTDANLLNAIRFGSGLMDSVIWHRTTLPNSHIIVERKVTHYH